jgi:hypothetical protein
MVLSYKQTDIVFPFNFFTIGSMGSPMFSRHIEAGLPPSIQLKAKAVKPQLIF